MARSIYSVSQINSYIRRIFSDDFALKNLYIKGEISNCKYHTSGHIYFTLKDLGGVISGVMFAGNRGGLKFKLEEGQNVIINGSISVYERDGKYQIYANTIELEGSGELYKRFEELKNRLEEMGMFSAEYKKTIPKFAMNIGIVTAKTGAAIQDIINITKRRNPYVKLYLMQALVQGEGAADSIVKALEKLDAMNMDVIIVGRGGGSIEDLWAFNEEKTARAVFECNTPIISAVGHETDTTIVDYVADLRAPTPSAAAELAVFDYEAFEKQLTDYKHTINKLILLNIENKKNNLEHCKTKLKFLSPANQIIQKRQYISDLQDKLRLSIEKTLRDKKYVLSLYAQKLNSLSPLNRLSGGYAFVSDNTGRPILDINRISKDDILDIQLRNGLVKSKVTDIDVERKINGGE